MTRIFRAFLWLRWRVFVNSLERTGARDTLERFSLATEKLGPIIALVLLIPSSIALAAIGLVAGYGTASGSWPIPLELVRYFLLASTAFTLIGPIILPLRDAGNVVRFLLLPIPRAALYTAHATGAIADPWVLLTVPPLLMIPTGLAAGGRVAGAAIALVAGALFLLVVIGLTTVISAAIHLLLRDRRRSDLVMLLLVVVLPTLGLIPSMMQAKRVSQAASGRPAAASRRAEPSAVAIAARRAFGALPSELYTAAAKTPPGHAADALAPLAGLGALAVAIQALGLAAFSRTLDMPVSLGARRAGAFGRLWARRLPGLTPGASAVALAHVRLALRTPRGRSMVIAPLLMLIVFGMLVRRTGEMVFPGVDLGSGLGLATFTTFVSVMAILPFAMNQFAIDKAGFTREMLLPLSVGELLAGKAVGNAVVAFIPALCCFVLSALLFPGGHPALWIALLLALAAIYVLVAPVAAALSAMFPRAVDLSSIGNGSNAHQAAGLLGMLAFVAAAVPCVLLSLLATRYFERPELAPVFLIVWLAVVSAVSRLLFVPVRRLVASRCETLAQYY